MDGPRAAFYAEAAFGLGSVEVPVRCEGDGDRDKSADSITVKIAPSDS